MASCMRDAGWQWVLSGFCSALLMWLLSPRQRWHQCGSECTFDSLTLLKTCFCTEQTECSVQAFVGFQCIRVANSKKLRLKITENRKDCTMFRLVLRTHSQCSKPSVDALTNNLLENAKLLHRSQITLHERGTRFCVIESQGKGNLACPTVNKLTCDLRVLECVL